MRVSSVAVSGAVGAVLAAGSGYLWLNRKTLSAPGPVPVAAPARPSRLRDAPRGRTPLEKAVWLRDYSKVAPGMIKKEVRWWAGLPDQIVSDGISPEVEHWLYGPREPRSLSSFGVRVRTVQTDMVVTFRGDRVAEVRWGEPFSRTEFEVMR